jgi:hypothetical protein
MLSIINFFKSFFDNKKTPIYLDIEMDNMDMYNINSVKFSCFN